VRFRVDGANFGSPPNVTLVNGVATSGATSSLTLGAHTVTAEYLGSTNFAVSSDTLDGGHVVNRIPTSTTLVSVPNPSTLGESVTFTATVTGGTGTPTGTVQFRADGANLGGAETLNGSGVATTSTTSLAAGTRVITADYAGTTTLAPSADTLDQLVASAGTPATIAAVTSLAVSGTVGGSATPAPTVLVTDGFGNPVPDVSVTFTPSAGSVSASPTLTGPNGQASVSWTLGLTAGTQTLEAAVAGLSGSPVVFTASASPGPLTQVVVSPANPTLTALGATQQFTAQGFDANGNAVVPQPVFTWSSGTPGTATIDAGTGLATAVANETTVITASAGGVDGTTTLTVAQAVSSIVVSPADPTLTALGATQQFTAQALDALGQPLAVQPVFTWSSGTPETATIDAGTGLATAVANGTTVITASAAEVDGTTILTVAT
jgi:hypothetical protein